jgi:hypothetical protein
MSQKRQTQSARLSPGEPVKIIADVGIRNDDDSSVRSLELRGECGNVAGANATYENAETGEEMVGVSLDSGGLVAVPTAAIRRKSGRRSFGGFRLPWLHRK